MVQSHDGAIKSVLEKGDALLSSVHYPSIRDKMSKLQKDYTGLCNTALVRSCTQMTVVLFERKGQTNVLSMQAEQQLWNQLHIN